MEEARTLLPGGVNSPVRAFRSVGGNPIVFDRVKGAYAWDVDGNKYIDYVGSWGPAIVGHANDEVNDAIKAQIDKGTSFGAPCELENVLAKMVIERVPSVEMVRFVSSGTEACLSVLRLMRAFTGREKIVKFVGCYHGHADSFLVKAGSGVATLGLPDSPGTCMSCCLTCCHNDSKIIDGHSEMFTRCVHITHAFFMRRCVHITHAFFMRRCVHHTRIFHAPLCSSHTHFSCAVVFITHASCPAAMPTNDCHRSAQVLHCSHTHLHLQRH